MTRLVGMSSDDIKEAAKLVRAGGLIAYPTDTVYGIGCDPFNADALDRLVRAKARVKGWLPILVDSFEEAERLGEMNQVAKSLAGGFWPGPVTLVVVARNDIPRIVTGHSSFVGLRIPNHEMTRLLIRESGGRIIGTSANISGRPSLRTAEKVLSELNGRVDLVLNGGPATLGQESTVVKILGGEVTVLREGAISRDDILKALPVTQTH